MAKYRVHNDNVYPYTEKFKDTQIDIPAKGSIVMDEDDAFMFKGTFKAPILDVDNNHTPQGYKMIRLEKLTGEEPIEEPKATVHRCLACKYAGSSAADVAEHAKAAHSDQIVVDEAAEAEIKARTKGKKAS